MGIKCVKAIPTSKPEADSLGNSKAPIFEEESVRRALEVVSRSVGS